MTQKIVSKGIAGSYLFSRQSAYGTAVSAAKDIGLVTNYSFNPDGSATERFGAGQSKSVYSKGGLVKPKGNIEIELQHGRPIEWAIYGGTTTHSDSTDDCTHTFVYADQLPPITHAAGWVEPSGSTNNISTSDLLFNNTTLSLDVDGILGLKSDFLCGPIDTSGTSTSAAVVNSGGPLGGFEGGASINSVAYSMVQSWSLTFNRNTKQIPQMGARAPAYGATHQSSCTWKAQVGVYGMVLPSLLQGATSSITAAEPASFPSVFTATNGIALGSGERSISLALADCQMKSYNITSRIGDFVLLDIEGIGILSTGTMVDQVLTADW